MRRFALIALTLFAACDPPEPETPAGPPELLSCRAGDSRACNDLGQRLAATNAYPQAREIYGVGCARIFDDFVMNARRLVTLDVAIRREQLAIRDGGAEATSDDVAQRDADEREIREIEARIRACIYMGDAFAAENQMEKAAPFYEQMCKLAEVTRRVDMAIPGFESLVGSACDAAQRARAR